MNKELEETLKRVETMAFQTNAYSLCSDGITAFKNDCDTIKSALERKDKLETENEELKVRNEKLEKAFHTLSKEDEKTKKLLSLEIEKNRKLQIIEEKFDIFCVFKMKDLDGKEEYIIDIRPKPNKHSNTSGNFLTKEEYESILGQEGN